MASKIETDKRLMAGSYQYAVEEHGGTAHSITAPASRTGVELRTFATFCAEDYHSNHDGWESTWPLTFVLYTESDQLLGRFVVDRETVPEFHATEVTSVGVEGN